MKKSFLPLFCGLMFAATTPLQAQNANPEGEEFPDPSMTWRIESIEEPTTLFVGVVPGEVLYIDWGDGTKPDKITENNAVRWHGNLDPTRSYGNKLLHDYKTTGEYTVRFYGENEETCPLLTLEQWWMGDIFNRLDVRKASQLHSLSLIRGELTQLDVSRNTELVSLVCTSIELTNLDVSNNHKLVKLECGYNEFTDLDLSNNTALKWLWCFYNELTDLDLSNNRELFYLYCHENQFTNLDVRNNTALQYLYCHDNQLSDLDLSNNTALVDLFCYNNQLTDLDVSNNKALERLECFNNTIPLINLPALAQRTDISWKQLGWQYLPDSIVWINTAVAIDTVFYGVNTEFDVNNGSTAGYTLNGGEITFHTPGDYTVQIRNPAILDGVVQQKFSVAQAVTGISLDRTKLTLEVGGSAHLFATVEPAGAQRVIWSSDNTGVATADDYWEGVGSVYVTAVGLGTATITATTWDGSKSASCVVTVRTLSNDATLTNITVSSGELSPTFDPNITEYTVTVAYNVTSVNISYDKNHEGATVSEQIVGNTKIITVTAEDGVTERIYTVSVFRAAPSNDATLKNITVSVGELQPSFSSAVTAYTVDVANNVSSITITGVANHTGAKVAGNVNGKTLAVGENKVTITVTAEDDTSIKTYTVTVNRAAPLTSVEELFIPDLKIYPNPFTGEVRITSAEDCTLQVFNVVGTAVHAQHITNPDETIIFEHLPAGVYFFRFEKGGNVKTIHVIKN